jgi:hypothetical protein
MSCLREGRRRGHLGVCARRCLSGANQRCYPYVFPLNAVSDQTEFTTSGARIKHATARFHHSPGRAKNPQAPKGPFVTGCYILHAPPTFFLGAIAYAASPRRSAERLCLSETVAPLFFRVRLRLAGPSSGPPPNDLVQIHQQGFVFPRPPAPATCARPSIILGTLGQSRSYRVLMNIVHPLHEEAFAKKR